MRFLLAFSILLVAVSPWALAADQKSDAKKVAAKVLAKFEYPGSKREKDHNVGPIAQTVRFTPDSLEKVNAWYHSAFQIGEETLGGIANVPWPTGVKIDMAEHQQQWALFHDEIRPKDDGSGNKTIRERTTRAFVVRTPEHTIVVIANRTPEDTQTMISVNYLGDNSR